MITLKGVSKYQGASGARRPVLLGVNGTFEAGVNYVVFGARGAGKSTLLRLLSGLLPPNRGKVIRRGTVSIPIGFPGMIAGPKSARMLCMFLAPFYKADGDAVWRFVRSFSGLDPALADSPMSDLPAPLRLQISYALGYALPADFLLFDDSVAHFGPQMKPLCLEAFQQRRATCGTIVTSRHVNIGDVADKGVVLHGAKLYFFDTVAEAAAVFEQLELKRRLTEEKPGCLYAQALVDSKKTAEARAYLMDYTSRNTRDAQAREMLASLSFDQGEHSQAAAAAQAALELDPASAKANWVLARVADQEDRPQDAAELARKAVAADPANKEAQKLLARSLEKMRKFGEAADAWRALATPGEDSLFLRMVIRNEFAAENWAGVLASLDSLSQVHREKDVGRLEMRAKALIELRRFGEVGEVLGALVRQDVERADMFFRRLINLTADWILAPELLLSLSAEEQKRMALYGNLQHLLVLLERRVTKEAAQEDVPILRTEIEQLKQIVITKQGLKGLDSASLAKK